MTPQEISQRDAAVQAVRRLDALGMNRGSTGNLSLRCGEGMLITPTGMGADDIGPQDLVWLGWDGTQRGDWQPSSEWHFHQAIYLARPDLNAVLHTHSTQLVQLSLQGVWREDDLLPPITPYFVMKVGHVPLVPYRRPGDPATADAVADRISLATARGRPIRAVLLDRLGPLVWAPSPATAMATLEELEETARLWLGCDPRPEPLDDFRIDELRRDSGAPW